MTLCSDVNDILPITESQISSTLSHLKIYDKKYVISSCLPNCNIHIKSHIITLCLHNLYIKCNCFMLHQL